MKNNTTIMAIIGHVAIFFIRTFSIMVAFMAIEFPVLVGAWLLGADDEIRATIMVTLFIPMCWFAWKVFNIIISLIVNYDKRNKKRKGA